MLLLNKGMMQLAKNAFHNNFTGLGGWGTAYLGVTFLEDDLSNDQGDKIKSLPWPFRYDFIITTGWITVLDLNRSLFSNRLQPLTPFKKSHGATASESVFRLAELNSVFTITKAGTFKTLMVTAGLPPSMGDNIVRLALFYSVGLPDSGADIELEKVDFVVGERVKLNDLVINIENLLGEA